MIPDFDMNITRLLETRDANCCWRRRRPARRARPVRARRWIGAGGKARRGDRDRDLAAADHDAGHRALGLQVEHVDDVAFGAALDRLAAHGQIKPGGFVDQRDVLVALHEVGLGEIGDLAGPGRRAAACASACRPRGRAARRSLPTSAFGRRSMTTSEDLRISLRSTLRVSTAASTVSTAVPVKRSRVGAARCRWRSRR